jgi:hypothetical protein
LQYVDGINLKTQNRATPHTQKQALYKRLDKYKIKTGKNLQTNITKAN